MHKLLEDSEIYKMVQQAVLMCEKMAEYTPETLPKWLETNYENCCEHIQVRAKKLHYQEMEPDGLHQIVADLVQGCYEQHLRNSKMQ